MTWTPAEGGGGGLEKWGSVSGPLFCVTTDVGAKGKGTQNLARKSFSTNNSPPPPPHLSSQNDQRDVGVILSHRCWVDPPPPRHGRSGTPALNPPPPPVTAAKEGGGWENGLPCHPPPQSNFLPALGLAVSGGGGGWGCGRAFGQSCRRSVGRGWGATTSTSSNRPLLGAADTHTAHHATFSTAPTYRPLGSANAETTPAGAPAAAADRTQRPDATCEGMNG